MESQSRLKRTYDSQSYHPRTPESGTSSSPKVWCHTGQMAISESINLTKVWILQVVLFSRLRIIWRTQFLLLGRIKIAKCSVSNVKPKNREVLAEVNKLFFLLMIKFKDVNKFNMIETIPYTLFKCWCDKKDHLVYEKRSFFLRKY